MSYKKELARGLAAHKNLGNESFDKNADRFHPLGNPCTSRTMGFVPDWPPSLIDHESKLPLINRSEIIETLEHQAGLPKKFSPDWESIHTQNYTRKDYYRMFKSRLTSLYPKEMQEWAKQNPELSEELEKQWKEFLKPYEN